VGTGTSTISAKLGTITGSTVLTVTAAALRSIAVTPANPSITKGTTQQFTATGTYTDNSTANLTSQVTWASATTTVATITTAGLATAVATGTSTISAKLGSISGSTVLTVTDPALQSIAVTPANPSIAKGLKQQFTATGTYSDNSTADLTSQVTWASATTTVATISAAGLATAVGTGTSTISAKLGSITGSTVLTVTAAALQSIAVTPANPTIAKGTTQQFTATGTYTDSSTKDLSSQVTWGSATTSVATISSAGLATALAAGTSTISAMLDGVGGSTVLTVTAAALQSIVISPANPSVPKGEVQIFTAEGTFSDNTTKDLTTQVTWTSSDSSVATISNSSGTQGVATSVATGTTTIKAALGGVTASTVLTVTPAVLEMIMISPTNPSIIAGNTEQFMAMGMYSDNSTQDLTTQVTWTSSDTSVSTISNALGSEGLATGVAPGTSTITAKFDGMDNSTKLTVTPSQPPVLSPAVVKDNSQGGYYNYGLWTTNTGGGYLGNYAVTNPATSSTATSRWTMTVPAGTYDLYATWVSAASNATNAGYSIYDGFTKLGSVSENQQVAPADGSYGGVLWAKLGTFTVTNGRVTVALSASGADGNIIADGVLLVSQSTNAMVMASASSAGRDLPPPASGPMGPMPQMTMAGSAPAGTTASPMPVPTEFSISPSAGRAAAVSDPGKSASLTHHALRKIKAKHHLKVHEALIERIARERLSNRTPSINHRKGK
jgi:uncharacterized protein YjdB